VIADLVARVLEAPLVRRSELRALDAIVVLGSPLGPHESLTPVLAERARAAAALWRAGGGPIVVASGGMTGGARRAEADVLAETIRAAGVPEVLVERASHTTAENARFTAKLLGPVRVWIVTQPFHARRAERLFRRAGFDAHAWHIEDSIQYRERRRAVRWLAREYVAWAAMFARRR
jgi:uncharacterized SAM-binding protein YcdF (DUF218 family)